jgi:hypothetical protein
MTLRVIHRRMGSIPGELQTGVSLCVILQPDPPSRPGLQRSLAPLPLVVFPRRARDRGEVPGMVRGSGSDHGVLNTLAV